MKKYFTIILSFIAFTAAAQTPFDMASSHAVSTKTKSASVSSMANPWIGAKFAYNAKGDVSNAFVLSGRVLYTPYQTERFAFPVVGNIGLNNADSLSQDNGFSAGIFPYYILSGNDKIKLLAHGGFNYHFVDNADATINELRFLAGLEVALYGKDGGSPTTLSVAPEFITNDGSTRTSLGLTGILPVANGLGLLVEGDFPLDNNVSTGVKIGFIVNGQVK